MARNGSPLDSGDKFPTMTVTTIDGSSVTLPDALNGHFAAVLFYRGKWCPFCNRQLKSYQRGLSKLTDEDIKVFALSVDTLEDAKAIVEEHAVTFPVAYGLEAAATSEAIGAFFDASPSHVPRPYLHSTGFLLAPDGSIAVSVYSSSAIGRLDYPDVIGTVQYIRSHMG